MTIRVRPADVEVPPDDPFQNNLLDRKPSIETLTSLLGFLEGPCVLALDSEWGGGKTTFMKMWAAYLRNEHYAVVEFNAWETDFSGDPFVALSSRLLEQLDHTQSDAAAQSVERFKVAAKRIALRAAPIAIRLLSQGLLESGSLEQAIAEEVSSYAKDRLEQFDEVEQSFVDFKESLQGGAIRLSEKHDNQPLFIMIDELDRCRPSYAIELLEIAKHLFSVDRIVFVLAINRSELAHSVKALYGSKFGAKGYLRRFFDLDYLLPAPDRERFVLQVLSDNKLSELFQKDSGAFQIAPTVIARILAYFEIDLRRIAQVIHRLALVCGSLDSVSPASATAAAVLLVFRECQPEVYTAFVAGTIDDMNVIEQIYQNDGFKKMEFTNEGYFLEATVCQAWFELATKAGKRLNSWDASRLYKSYNSTISDARETVARERRVGQWEGFSEEKERRVRRAEGVINACTGLQSYADEMRFRAAIRRIELLPII